MTEFNQNIVEQARQWAEKKTTLERISNSLRPILAKKYRGKNQVAIFAGVSAINTAVNLLKIPVISTVISEGAKFLYEKKRKILMHKRYLVATTNKDFEEMVKYGLKDIKLEKVRSNQLKVKNSIEELVTECSAFKKISTENLLCDDFYLLAAKTAQAERRIKILENDAAELIAIGEHINEWLMECRLGLSKNTSINENLLTSTPITDILNTIQNEMQLRAAQISALECGDLEHTLIGFKPGKIAEGGGLITKEHRELHKKKSEAELTPDQKNRDLVYDEHSKCKYWCLCRKDDDDKTIYLERVRKIWKNQN